MKPVKQEVNGTVILPPLVFLAWTTQSIQQLHLVIAVAIALGIAIVIAVDSVRVIAVASAVAIAVAIAGGTVVVNF